MSFLYEFEEVKTDVFIGWLDKSTPCSSQFFLTLLLVEMSLDKVINRAYYINVDWREYLHKTHNAPQIST